MADVQRCCGFVSCAVVALVAAGGCGDDTTLAFAGAGGDEDAGVDSGPPPRRDAGLDCTELPEVSSPGTGSADAGVDPQPLDDAMSVAFDPMSVPLDAAAFPLGVQAGAMRADGVRLWTLIGDAEDKVLRVWRESDDPTMPLLVHEETVNGAATDGYVHVDVPDLAPATVYRYAFFSGTAMPGFTGRSPVGRVRTALPAGSRAVLRIGATTCTGSADPEVRAELEPYPSLSRLAGEELDLLLHVGDISYNDGATTREEYRASWTNTLSQSGYQDVLRSTGWYATWDDHEVGNNWDPETEDPTRVTNATDAYFETLAVERGAGGGLWTSYQWGDTAEFIVTDLRSERRPSTMDSADPQFISDEQMAFVQDRLLNTTAHFKLVFSSVNMTGLNNVYDVGISLNDRWEGYAAQREELLSFIVENDIRNVWFIAGDIHNGFVGRLEPEGEPYSHMWEITVGPGGSAPNPLGLLYEDGNRIGTDAYQCDMFVFAHGHQHVATTLELDPVADTIAVRFVDVLTDEVLFDDVLQQGPTVAP